MSAAVLSEGPQVLARALKGDAEAFAHLIEPMLDPAYRLAAIMLVDRPAAEDAVQEASIKAWTKLRQLRGNLEHLRPWFLSIVANECRMARRGRWWSVVKVPDLPSPPRPADDASGDLHQSLLRLTQSERLPLVLHFYLDLPLADVARILGVSPAAAKSRIYRTAKRLRSELTEREVF
jgi:RNA polymerase sigma-70 factor (ECF subfamily)